VHGIKVRDQAALAPVHKRNPPFPAVADTFALASLCVYLFVCGYVYVSNVYVYVSKP
jgi:hypothetical protein